jgi:N-methylhydantoinase B
MGDPYSRDPEAVLWDVRRGLVSGEAAREEYGVVITGGAIDEERTRAVRAVRTNGGTRPTAHSDFAFGAERDAYESFWTDAMQFALSRALRAFPSAQRGYLRVAAMDEAERRVRAGEMLRPEDVAGVIRGIAARLSDQEGGTAGAGPLGARIAEANPAGPAATS